MVKLNWDAAVNVGERKIGLGIIAHDHTDQVLAVFVASRQYIIDPIAAEALATWKMAEICVFMGFQEVHFEGDSLDVVQALVKRDYGWRIFLHVSDIL